MTTKKTTEFIFLFLLVFTFTFSLSLFSASPFGYDIDDTPGTYTYFVNNTYLSIANGTGTFVQIAGDTMTGSLNISGTGVSLLINQNVGAPISSIAGTAISARGADNALVRIAISSYGIGGVGAFANRHARGTAASPTAVSGGDTLFSLEGWGYGATAYSVSSRAMIRGYASQIWNDTNQPTYLSFWTSKNHTIAPIEQWRIHNDGSLTAGATGTSANQIVTAGNISANNMNLNGNFVALGNINISSNATIGGDLIIKNSNGATVRLNNFVEHTQEMMTDTLIDKSRSTLSVVDGVLNYTLIAFYGCGQFNFGGVLYPISGSECVQNATITLTKGTNITPVTNYVYWELVGDVPTMKTSSTYPSTDHIDVATFVVGSVSATTANIYSYSRNRYEVDSFVKRVIARFEESGTLYSSGFQPAANTSQINVSSGGKFFNGIFEMTSTNSVRLSERFYYINSTGHFIEAKNLASFTQYSNGVAFKGGANERVNIVWGVVPVNTTGGTGPTQMRLVAVIPNEPATAYNSVTLAISDTENTANFFPPNSEIKAVFTPIARTILRPSTDLFEPFTGGLYYQDVRGKITSGGGAATSTDISGLVPYIGATKNVELDTYNITFNSNSNYISFNGSCIIAVGPGQTGNCL